MLKNINSFFNPERFQCWGQQKKYFEGWYYKIINKEETKAYAFIPGIAMDEKGKKHFFIQVLNGKNKTAEYLSFP
jgi:tocopherol cyclase